MPFVSGFFHLTRFQGSPRLVVCISKYFIHFYCQMLNGAPCYRQTAFYLPVHQPLGIGLLPLWLLGNAAVGMGVQVLLYRHVFNSLRCNPGETIISLTLSHATPHPPVLQSVAVGPHPHPHPQLTLSSPHTFAHMAVSPEKSCYLPRLYSSLHLDSGFWSYFHISSALHTADPKLMLE